MLSMRCPRCGGLLVEEYFLAPLPDSPHCFQGARCLNCGVILDDVIAANQALSLAVNTSPCTVPGDGLWNVLAEPPRSKIAKAS